MSDLIERLQMHYRAEPEFETLNEAASEIASLQQSLADVAGSTAELLSENASLQKQLAERTAELDAWNEMFVSRVVAEHGTTIDILSKRLDEYAARIQAAEAREKQLLEALDKAQAKYEKDARDLRKDGFNSRADSYSLASELIRRALAANGGAEG